MGFDIQQARTEAEAEDAGTEVKVKTRLGQQVFYVDPADGETKPSVIIMAGKHSRRYRRKEKEQRDRRIKPGTLTEGKFYDDAEELAVACAMGWRGIGPDESPTPFNEHNLLEVWHASPWNYDDCVEAMNSPARFSTSSSPTQ